MKVNPSIFRGYDIRGLVGDDLSEELAEKIGRAMATYMRAHALGDQAVVGRDSRESSPAYAAAVVKGLQAGGINVTDIGMQLVGMFYWSQYHLSIPAGVYVSASHNPPQFNGFKLANGLSETMVSDGITEIRELVESEAFEEAAAPGTYKEVDIRPAYRDDLLARLSVEKPLRVVVDPSNTTSGEIAPDIFRAFGCEVIEYNTAVDSSFPLGVADPTESTVVQRLAGEVVTSRADIGFTFDADGDRIGIVDENGGIIWNDVLVAIFAADVLADRPGSTIMFNTLCSKVVPETIKAHGGTPFMWRTGHSFLKKKNQEVGAAFIGELSGHFFFSADFYNHDDGIYSALRLLQYLSRTGQKLSQVVAELPKYLSSPEIKVFCADTEKMDVVARLAGQLRKDFPDAEVIDDERAGDGVRLEMPDSMFVVRYSQNGPYLTIKFEAKTKEGYEKLRGQLADLLHQYKEIDWHSEISVNVEALTEADPS